VALGGDVGPPGDSHETRGFWCESHLAVRVDVTPTSPTSNASMMRKIHMGLSQDDQVNHGLFTLFTWAKEISKI